MLKCVLKDFVVKYSLVCFSYFCDNLTFILSEPERMKENMKCAWEQPKSELIQFCYVIFLLLVGLVFPAITMSSLSFYVQKAKFFRYNKDKSWNTITFSYFVVSPSQNYMKLNLPSEFRTQRSTYPIKNLIFNDFCHWSSLKSQTTDWPL